MINSLLNVKKNDTNQLKTNKQFECCGYNGPTDWVSVMKVPKCKTLGLFTDGCKAAFTGYIVVLAGVAVGVLFVEVRNINLNLRNKK